MIFGQSSNFLFYPFDFWEDDKRLFILLNLIKNLSYLFICLLIYLFTYFNAPWWGNIRKYVGVNSKYEQNIGEATIQANEHCVNSVVAVFIYFAIFHPSSSSSRFLPVDSESAFTHFYRGNAATSALQPHSSKFLPHLCLPKFSAKCIETADFLVRHSFLLIKCAQNFL